MHTDAGRATRRVSGVSDGDRTRNPRSHRPRTFSPSPAALANAGPANRGDAAKRLESGEFRGVKTSDARGPRRGKPSFSKALRDVVDMFGHAFDEARAQ
jgi:hypothetical protein